MCQLQQFGLGCFWVNADLRKSRIMGWVWQFPRDNLSWALVHLPPAAPGDTRDISKWLLISAVPITETLLQTVTQGRGHNADWSCQSGFVTCWCEMLTATLFFLCYSVCMNKGLLVTLPHNSHLSTHFWLEKTEVLEKWETVDKITAVKWWHPKHGGKELALTGCVLRVTSLGVSDATSTSQVQKLRLWNVQCPCLRPRDGLVVEPEFVPRSVCAGICVLGPFSVSHLIVGRN